MKTGLRRMIGKALGYQAEIDSLTLKLREVSWDHVFGMWTRAAFLQFCTVMPRGERIVVFIDLDSIHSLNNSQGYAEVDRRVRNTFSVPMRSSDIVARWYSGDEIVILFDNDRDSAMIKIAELQVNAAGQGLTFTFETGDWNVGVQSIVDVVNALSSANRLKQAGRKEAR